MLNQPFWKEYGQLVSKTSNYFFHRSKIQQMEEQILQETSYMASNSPSFSEEKEFLRENMERIEEYSTNLSMQEMILRAYSVFPRTKKLKEISSLQEELRTELKVHTALFGQIVMNETSIFSFPESNFQEVKKSIEGSNETIERALEKEHLKVEQEIKDLEINREESVSELTASIKEKLTSEELRLFKQLNRKKIESLDNYYNDSWASSSEEATTYEQLCKDFTPQQIEKVECLYLSKVDSGNSPLEKTSNIHMDELERKLQEQELLEGGIEEVEFYREEAVGITEEEMEI